MHEEPTQLAARLEGEMKRKFEAVKGYYGFEKNADLLRLLITQKFEEIKTKVPMPLEQINAGENGVLLHDRNLRKAVDVFFRPQGIQCSYHKSSDCEHVRFALAIPEVEELLRKKAKGRMESLRGDLLWRKQPSN